MTTTNYRARIYLAQGTQPRCQGDLAMGKSVRNLGKSSSSVGFYTTCLHKVKGARTVTYRVRTFFISPPSF